MKYVKDITFLWIIYVEKQNKKRLYFILYLRFFKYFQSNPSLYRQRH